jgi:hypothetical protein
MYKKLKAHRMTEAELRQLWSDEYCDHTNPIETFDGIQVRFYSDMFEHAFFESSNWKKKDKSELSYPRCERMLWIKDVLQDDTAILKEGWLKEEKKYSKMRRVALVKDDYVVIIALTKPNVARFITAYTVDNEENLEKILESPDWIIA